jgi:hypothetical protein
MKWVSKVGKLRERQSCSLSRERFASGANNSHFLSSLFSHLKHAATFLLWGACPYRTEYGWENFPSHEGKARVEEIKQKPKLPKKLCVVTGVTVPPLFSHSPRVKVR